MLYTEWNLDDAIAVAREEGMEEGMEKGIEKGREEGREEGIAKGVEKGRLEIARNLLAKGSTPEFVSDITGLDMEAVKNLFVARV